MSTTWYTWLEQGRDINPGPDALVAVCRSLGLDDEERRYVRRLARRPVVEPYEHPAAPDPALVTLVSDLMPNPACVATESYDLLAWNDAYAKVLHDPATLDPVDRNAIWIAFMMPEVRQRTIDWLGPARPGSPSLAPR